MENNQELALWTKLANQLSGFAVKKNIDLSEVSGILSEHVSHYARENTLKGVTEIVDMFHMINGHEEYRIKIDCQKRHCIECYTHLVCDKALDPNNLYCTCSKQINPKIKSRFLNEFKRIQEMKLNCEQCLKRQDKMNFAALRYHDCNVCTNCIKETFVYEKGKKNSCRKCQVEYIEECELILRDLKEMDVSEESKSNFYREKCHICQELKDSRHFTEICQSRHLSCKTCIETKRKNNETTCSCGLDISINDNR